MKSMLLKLSGVLDTLGKKCHDFADELEKRHDDSREGVDSVLDLRIGNVIDSGDVVNLSKGKYASSHLIVVGNTKSGKTTALCNLLEDASSQSKVKNSEFYVFDTRGVLETQVSELRRKGAKVTISRDAKEFVSYFEEIHEKLQARVPSSDELRASTYEDRKFTRWHGDSEIFVVIENLTEIERALPYGDFPFGSLMSSRSDLGCRVFATLPSHNAMSMGTTSMKVTYSILKDLAVVTLSGNKEDYNCLGVKFEKRDPGVGILMLPNRDEFLIKINALK